MFGYYGNQLLSGQLANSTTTATGFFLQCNHLRSNEFNRNFACLCSPCFAVFFSFLNDIFIISQVIHCTASVIRLDIAEAPFCRLLLIHDYHLHGSFTTLLVELEQELSFLLLSEILYVPRCCF